MGLEIYAYKNITKATGVHLDDDGEIINSDTGEYVGGYYFRPYINPDFPGRADGIDPDSIYAFEDSVECLEGSYSGYSGFRETLAKIAGYDQEVGPHGRLTYCAACWRGEKGPFWQMINFADNEGVIGTEACKSLARDFKKYLENASREDEWFFTCYKRLMAGVEMAAQNGALEYR